MRFFRLLLPVCAGWVVVAALGCAGCAREPHVVVQAPPRPAPAPPVAAPPPPPAPTPSAPVPQTQNLSELQVRIRYAQETQALGIHLTAPAVVRGRAQELALPPGHWKLTVGQIRPAPQRFHVFPKTFQPGEEAALETYLTQWRQQGQQPETEIFGKQLKAAGGRIIDNRQYWASLARTQTQAEAEALIKRLSAQQVWAWQRAETVAQGQGLLTISNAAGQVLGSIPLPARLESSAPVDLMNVDSGFWREVRSDRSYLAPLSLEVGPTGALEVLGLLPLETYLRGVVPAEMPASWPAQALAAQAVAARSEVLFNLAGKHRLEGFDFCALEHCRAYRGLGGHQATTDAAVQSTHGEVLVSGFRTVPTVFSANCGGWTENNENVWSGPLNPALRAVADFPAGAGPRGIGAPAQWVGSKPGAWCAGDTANFRWTRRHSATELSAMVNKYHKIGAVQSIAPGERGPSGRLKSCRVTGSAGSVTIEKELNIRLAFGGLPSAVFTVENAGGAFVFRGAGRGHGVGMCQHGARAMAAAGHDHARILLHYFSGVDLAKMVY